MSGTPTSPGWVYILTNKAMPGMVKIGLTTKTAKERAAELSSASGVPLPFVVAWAWPVSDCAYVEKAVHRMLDDKRVNGRRESFRVSVREGRRVIKAVAASKLDPRYKAPPARPRWTGQRGQAGRRRRKGRENLPLLLTLSSMALMVILMLFHPPLPGWLPGPVRDGFQTVEAWR